MQIENLRKKYHFFMREFIDNKYFKNLTNVKVLGENFVFNYYIVIFQCSMMAHEPEVYIIIENIPKCGKPINLKVFRNPYNYITTKQKILIKNLPKKLYKTLLNNGVFESLETAQSDKNSTFSIHRLVMSIYTICLNQKVHHINYSREFNAICNLINMIKPKHDKLHRGNKDFAKLESLRTQNKLKLELARQKKNTLAENSIFELLELKTSGMRARQIERKINRRVRKSKIQEILNYFFYTHEFIIWLKNQLKNGIPLLNGQFKNRWEYILEFDKDS